MDAETDSYYTEARGSRESVDVRYISASRGKGLFAAKPFVKGESIFIERPYVAMQWR